MIGLHFHVNLPACLLQPRHKASLPQLLLQYHVVSHPQVRSHHHLYRCLIRLTVPAMSDSSSETASEELK